MTNSNEFIINKYITLKLEHGATTIYIQGKLFHQCKYLLLNVPLRESENVDEIDSIDEASCKLDHSRERGGSNVSPEVEFWGHCSNIQAWVEHDYDTRILHRNLAFPLLKKLTEVGDPKAKSVFKEEIARRLERRYSPVIRYLIQEGYVDTLSKEELHSLDPDTVKMVELITKTSSIARPRLNAEENLPERDDIEGWLEVIDELEANFRYNRVGFHLTILHAHNPLNQEILIRLADLHFRIDLEELAFGYYMKLLRLVPENIYVLSRIGIILSKWGYRRCTFKLCLRVLELDPHYFKIMGLIRDVALSGYTKAFRYIRLFIQEKIDAKEIGYLEEFLTEYCLLFFTSKELENIFEMISPEQQQLLKRVNGLINRKRIIESLRARKRITISNERIHASHADF